MFLMKFTSQEVKKLEEQESAVNVACPTEGKAS